MTVTEAPVSTMNGTLIDNNSTVTRRADSGLTDATIAATVEGSGQARFLDLRLLVSACFAHLLLGNI
jgi:hypothetical protein